MAVGVVNAEATLIPDKAEVWLILKSDVTDAASLIPESVDDDLAALGWEFTGLVDDAKGIPVTPNIEVKPYDAFGHPRFRVKLKKGTLVTGFTALERNTVTNKIVLPGSTAKRIGIPKDVQVYVLYRYVDEDRTTMWVQLTPAPAELAGTSGVVDGEKWWADIKIHHTANAQGDVFEIVDDATDDVVKTLTFGVGVTTYTATVGANTTPTITPKTKAALQTALRLLASVEALPEPGVTVDGPDGGPLVATFTEPVTVSASGTGGTATFA